MTRTSRTHRRLAAQRGFTLMEVLVAMVVFAISVVGLVALESRSIDSQRAAQQLREGERIAQQAMANITSRGFLELVARDFAGTNNPAFPYDDDAVDPGLRLRDFHRPPADIPAAEVVPGEVRGQYLVSRRVDWVVNPFNQPTINPPPIAEWSLVTGVEVDITVMWIDDTNPAFPPPDGLRTIDLNPAMTDPTSPGFSPFVASVRLRTVRVNDAVLPPAEGIAGG